MGDDVAGDEHRVTEKLQGSFELGDGAGGGRVDGCVDGEWGVCSEGQGIPDGVMLRASLQMNGGDVEAYTVCNIAE